MASKTNDVAGDGTTTSTVLARAIFRYWDEITGTKSSTSKLGSSWIRFWIIRNSCFSPHAFHEVREPRQFAAQFGGYGKTERRQRGRSIRAAQVVAGMNPMDLKRGIDAAVKLVLEAEG